MPNIKLFESKKVRTHWDEEKETWYFAIVDVIAILTESGNPQVYWRVMKKRLLAEGNETVTNCNALKMEASDGKMRMTDVADTQQLLRLIQSIPSPKAEPFKQWLAKVGYERMQEIQDPEMGLERARENWQKLGRSEKWIQQRMTGQETRNKLTDYWKQSGVEKSDEFAFLTNIIHQEWTGLTVKNHKDLKGLKSQNLRDHMIEKLFKNYPSSLLYPIFRHTSLTFLPRSSPICAAKVASSDKKWPHNKIQKQFLNSF